MLTDDVFLDLAGERGLISPRSNEREWSAGFNAKLIAFATALLADHSRDVTKLAAEQPSEDKRDAERHRWLREQHWNESNQFVVACHHSDVRLQRRAP
ncbi:hypothetical protein [Cupriavidus basilensis]|uniref:hypothetical protein n=1 Tax=Cupriavidus basilensis TaxID=68895 RepID=UPI0039F6C359